MPVSRALPFARLPRSLRSPAAARLGLDASVDRPGEESGLRPRKSRPSRLSGLVDRLRRSSLKVLLASGLVGLATQAAAPQTAAAQTIFDNTASVTLNDFSGAAPLATDGRHYLLVDHTINDGVGFDGDGFTSVGVHATLYDWGLTHLFSDARMMISNHNRIGWSGLVGVRSQRYGGVVGAWIGGDRWETNYSNEYSQLALGVEALFCDFDFRGNAYINNGDQNFIGFTGKSGDFRFTGNNLLFMDPALVEEQLGGLEAELGAPIPYAPWARGYAGIYGYDTDFGPDAVGARGRAEVRLTDEFTVNFVASHDRIFDGTFQVQGEWRFDGRTGNNVLLPAFDLGYRKHAPVRRNWIVATREASTIRDRVATNADGSALSFAVVDNNAAAGGPATGAAGTFENPFSDLPATTDAGIIVLRSSGTAYTGNIALQDGQQLVGEGKPIVLNTDCGPITLDTAGMNGLSGNFFNPVATLPVDTTAIGPLANAPTITGTAIGQPVITLANGNRVANLNVVGSSIAPAIAGDGITDFLIECVRATGDQSILLQNAAGNGIVRDSELVSLGGAGLQIVNTDTLPLNLTVNDVLGRGAAGGGVYGIDLQTTRSIIRTNLDNVALMGFAGAGVRGLADNGSILGTLNDVRVMGDATGGGAGFFFAGTRSAIDLRTTDLLATGVGNGGTPGFGLMLGDMSFGNLTLENATLSNNGGPGLDVTVDGQSNASVAVTGSQINANAGDGISADATRGSNLTLSIGDSPVDGNATQIVGNGGDAVAVASRVGSNVTLNAAGVLATGAGGDGFNLIADSQNSVLTANIANVDASGAGGDGFSAVAMDTGLLTLNVDSLDVTGAGNNGFVAAATLDGILRGTANTVDASSAGNDGFLVVGMDGATIDLDLTDVTATLAGDNGLQIAAVNAGGIPTPVTVDVVGGNFSASTNSNVVIGAGSDGAVARVNLDDVAANGSLNGDGVRVSAFDQGVAVVTGSNLTADSNLNGSGLVLAADGADTIATLAADGFSANDNGENGAAISAVNGGIANASLMNGTLNGNSLNGLDIDLETGGRSTIALDAPLTISGNGRDAIEYDVSGGSRLNLTADSAVLSNNGQFAIDGDVNDNGSRADVVLTNSFANNLGAGAFQFDVGTTAGTAVQVVTLENVQANNSGGNGFTGRVADGSRLNAFVTQSSLSGHAGDGFNLAADAASSYVAIDQSTLDNNGGDGVDFTASTFSNVDLNLRSTTASGNTGAGIRGRSASGSDTDVVLNSVATNGNGDDGITIATDNANTFVGQLNSTSQGNAGRGMELSNVNEGFLRLDAVNSGYFLNTGGSGVLVFTDGLSASDLCFTGTAANNNADHGYEIVTTGMSTSVTTLRQASFTGPVSGRNNVNAGLSVQSSSGGRTYFLTEGGIAEFSGNSAAMQPGESGAGVEFNLVDQAVAAIDFAGSSTGAAGDGIQVRMQDVAQAALQIGDRTLGTANLSGNGGDGLDVFVQSTAGMPATNFDVAQLPAFSKAAPATFDPFRIENNNASDTGGFGIVFTGNNIAIAAGTDPQIFANQTSGNVNDGIRVNLNDSNAPGDFSILQNVSNVNDGYGIAVALNNTAIGNLVIEDNTTTGNQLGGIVVFGVNGSSVGAQSISNNVVTLNGPMGAMLAPRSRAAGAMATPLVAGPADTIGDGIAVRFRQSTLGDVTIRNNMLALNDDRQILIDLVDTPTGSLDIDMNEMSAATMGGAGGQVGLEFQVVGVSFTEPYFITNTSDPGFDIEGFTLDLTPVNAIWDTIEPGASQPFRPNLVMGQMMRSDIVTGLQTVNGNPILQGSDPFSDPMGTPLPGGGLPDDQPVLTLTFDDFNAGETFSWFADLDFVGQPGSGVFGNDLIGANISVDFGGGVTLTGMLSALPGEPQGSQFIATGGSGLGGVMGNRSGSDGTLISAVNSDIGRIDFTGNDVLNVGDDGLDFALDMSVVGPIAITDNTITNVGGSGVRIAEQDTNGQPIDVTFSRNVITQSADAGLDLEVGDANRLVVVGGGNILNENENSGVRLTAQDDSTFELRLGPSNSPTFDSSISGNTENGVVLLVEDRASGDFALEGITIDGTLANMMLGGDAVSIAVQDNARLNSLAIRDSSLSGAEGRGLNLDLQQSAVVVDPTIVNTDFDNNGAEGIAITRRGSAKVDNISITGGSASGNATDGIQFALSGGATDVELGGPLTIDSRIVNMTIDDNAQNGVEFQTTADVQATIAVGGGSISGNGGNGLVAVSRSDSGQTVSVIGTEVSANGIDGVGIAGFDRTSQAVTVANATLSQNAGAAIEFTGVDTVTQSLQGADLVIDGNGVTEGNAAIDIVTTADARFDGALRNVEITGQQAAVAGEGDGIELTVDSSRGATLDLNNVGVSESAGTGIELTNNNSQLVSRMVDVRSDLNAERGLDVETNGGNTTVAITSTTNPNVLGQIPTTSFSDNGATGVFVRNTPQSPTVPANTQFTLMGAAVNGNGGAAGSTGDDTIGVLLLSGTGFDSLLSANIDGNQLQSNAGIDFVTRSFIAVDAPMAVVDPAESAAYEFDPLARLTLNLVNNVGDQIDVSQVGAFFTTTDPFKSTGALFPNAADRPRNATRVATDIIGAFESEVVAVQDPTFRFSGDPADLPDDTFRLNNDWLTFTSGANAGETNDIDVYNGMGGQPAPMAPPEPPRTFRFDPADDAFTAPVAIGDQFRVDSIAIAGVGASTFVSTQASVNGANVFNQVLSDFGDIVGESLFTQPAADSLVQPVQGYGWTISPTGTQPDYVPTVLGDDMAPFTDMTP